MRPSTAKAVVEELLETLAPGLLTEGWTVDINPRPQRLQGQCIYRQKKIILAGRYVALNDLASIQDTGRHEIAHALVGPGHGHDGVWQRQAILLGATPSPYDSTSVVVPGKYVCVCPNPSCGRKYYLYRKPKTFNRWCRFCGPIKGKMVVVPTDPTQTVSAPGIDLRGMDLDAICDEI